MFHLARQSLLLVHLNHVRTGYGRFKCNMNLVGLSPSTSCECGAENQTAQHMASKCLLQLPRGLGRVGHCSTQLASRPAVCRIELLNQTQEGVSLSRAGGGASVPGGICPRGHLSQGASVPGGICPRGHLSQGGASVPRSLHSGDCRMPPVVPATA